MDRSSIRDDARRRRCKAVGNGASRRIDWARSMIHDTLPGTLAAFARETSADSALALAVRFGGSRLYVPKLASALTPDHPLVAAIGIDAALRLVVLKGGERIDVPTARPYFRRREAARLHAQGMRPAQIASRLGICRRAAARLVAEMAGVRPQWP